MAMRGGTPPRGFVTGAALAPGQHPPLGAKRIRPCVTDGALATDNVEVF